MTARSIRRATERKAIKVARRVSRAQIAANQANSQLSSGPRSDEGKAIAAQNNVRHGLTGAFAVLPNEDQSAFDRLAKDLRKEYEPRSTSEDILVDGLAQHHWLIQRALRLQNELFATSDPADPGVQKQLALYIRYQTTNERAFHRCLAELIKLRKATGSTENGFVSQNRRPPVQKTPPKLYVRLGSNVDEADNQRLRESYEQKMKSYQAYLAENQPQ